MSENAPPPSGGGFGGLTNISTQIQQVVNAIRAAVQVLTKSFPQTVGTATTATGGAATLPGNPVGFLVVTLPNGTSAKIPYYAS